MQEPSALGRAIPLVRDLRNRCPWDGAQTPQTLRPYLVEEALELDQALGHGDPATVRDELGDVLLHLAFQIVLAEDAGHFGPEDVVGAVERKMWRRHPHLFPTLPNGSAEAAGMADAKTGAGRGGPNHASWEQTKLSERGDGGGVLAGLPPNLPSLIAAQRLQERAAGVGFDWPDATGPADKVREELAEVEHETRAGEDADRARVEHEIGDLLFAVVNLSRKLGCDARAALERANDRFTARFRHMERLAADRGITIGSVGLEALDVLWEEAKRAH